MGDLQLSAAPPRCHKHDAILQAGSVDLIAIEVIGALLARAAKACDELAQVAVAVQVPGERNERERCLPVDLELRLQ